MRRTVISIVATLVVSAAFFAQAAEPRSEAYVGGRGDLVAACGINSACFSIEASRRSATVLIYDASGGAIGAQYVFKTGTTTIGLGAFCGATDLAVPAGTTDLQILIKPISGCDPGTAGTVRLI